MFLWLFISITITHGTLESNYPFGYLQRIWISSLHNYNILNINNNTWNSFERAVFEWKKSETLVFIIFSFFHLDLNWWFQSIESSMIRFDPVFRFFYLQLNRKQNIKQHLHFVFFHRRTRTVHPDGPTAVPWQWECSPLTNSKCWDLVFSGFFKN